MERLYDKLKAYSESDFYAFHMPGHKRNKALLGIELPYDLDITEIDGFDDLHHADGILKEEQERAARVFGAEESHFLVNGSTAGILSAVMGCTHRGDKILVARHCHKSIYHAIYMNGLVPRYVYPEFDISMHMNGEISKEDVAKALAAEPDIKAVVIVSPNYDGVVSDVKGIAEVAHSYRIPLIVDEAHGPHFGFHPAFPGRANDLGADVVINSLHKTLPSLTQTAILHINGKLANRRSIWICYRVAVHPIFSWQVWMPVWILWMENVKMHLNFMWRDYKSSEKSWNHYSIYRFSVQNIMIFPKL